MSAALAPVRLAQLRPLVAPLRRAVVWSPVALVGVAGLVVLDLTLRTTDDPGAVLFRFRLCGVGLAAAAALVLDDPAAATLASSPTALLARRVHRIAVGVALAAASWLLMAARVGIVVGDVTVPGGSGVLALEVAAYLALAQAAAALTTPLAPDRLGGATGALVTFVFFMASNLVPPRFAPFPASPLQPGGTGRLAWDLSVAVALLAWASHDPAAGLRQRITRRHAAPAK